MSCLSWEWMLSLLPQLACSINFWHHLFCSKFGTRFYFSINLKGWRLTWPTHLCQIPMSLTHFPCVNNMKFISSMFTSKVNIRPFHFPFAINLPWFFMFSTKHPLRLNATCKPCSAIWPTNTKLFVMVGT